MNYLQKFLGKQVLRKLLIVMLEWGGAGKCNSVPECLPSMDNASYWIPQHRREEGRRK